MPRKKTASDALHGKMPSANTIGKTFCLNMIVKNEVANLERCLRSVADHISCWVIGDTGSTDGTQQLIERFFAARGIPGELHSFPFENFAQARNEALDRARASALPFDYILLTDADMELTVQNPAFSQDLTAAAYMVLQRSGVTYWNIRLLRRDVPARYMGVTHEYLDVRAGETKNLEGISFIDHATGANRVDKYQRDIRLLTDAIGTESGLIARYTFYLANTLRDSGDKEAALKTYLERAGLGHWYQEVFVSLLNAAQLKEALEYSNDDVISAYMEAAAFCPTRAEALHGAARLCRIKGVYERGYQFAKQGLAIPCPNEALFAQDWIYEYGLLDELAINAYWTARYAECVDACDRLLSEGKLPTEEHDRVLKNKNFAVSKLQEIAASSSPESGPFLELLRAAREKEELGRANDEIISAYMEATVACPTRAEALHGAARFCRNKGIYERGYEFAAQGLAVAYPNGAPDVENWIYEYGLLDELAINAYWAARYAECVDACDRLLSEGKLPTEEHDRVLKNKNFAVSKLQEIAASSSPESGPFLELLRAAREKEELGRANDEIISAYMEATVACPTRAEALHGAARFCRNKGIYERGYEFAAQGLAVAYPNGAPAVENWIYEYGLLDELAVNAYWTARHAESVDACDRLLNGPNLPSTMRERVVKNKQSAIALLRDAVSRPASLDTQEVSNPGISFVVRARNEEATLRESLESLQGLTIPHEIIVILHLCTDSSRRIAESFSNVRIYQYEIPVSRAGYETLITPDTSQYSLIAYYNWCFAKAQHLWCFKWDADFVATPRLLDFINGRDWNDATPKRIRIPAITPNADVSPEPYLFNAGRTYKKLAFWEYNSSLFSANVREEICPATLDHVSPLDCVKPYWRAAPWFESREHSKEAEALELRRRYRLIVEKLGPEPLGFARAVHPEYEKLYATVREREAELSALGIRLWS
jgi:glycosyltransferase involved in cell wall biosynthesis